MMRYLPLLLPLLFIGCATTPSGPPLRTVDYVDLDRYMGRWYVIANIPYFLEKGKVASYDTYTRRPDGKLGNDFTFRKGNFDAPEKTWNGVGEIVNTETNAEWKIQFVWPISSTLLVLELDPDYQWAVVGTPNRSLLWILGRDRQMSDQTYQMILNKIAAQGYDPATIAKVPQPLE